MNNNQDVGIPLENLVPNNVNNQVQVPAAPVQQVPSAPVSQEQVVAPAPVPAPAQAPVQAPVSAPVVTEPVASVTQPVPATPVATKTEEKNEVVTSGTVTEEQLVIDASKEKVEVLDEYEINKDAANMKENDKRKIAFIIIIFILLFGFIFAMPQIIAYFGY